MAVVTLKPHYQIINGLRFPFFKPESLMEAMSYKPAPEDVFIVTYPKCGTTWMQNIALYVFRKGKELENHTDFKIMCPFIDSMGIQGIAKMPRPGAFKTHLPFNLVPHSPCAKYIFVLRNPKDCCVSLYYHTKLDLELKYSDGKFDDFFELFMEGEVEYNDYFGHLMSWYPHHKDKQVFFTTYEDMKADTKSVVFQLAQFLGQEYIEAIEKDNNTLNKILQFSEFEYMKKNLSDKFNSVRAENNETKKMNEIETDMLYSSPSTRSQFNEGHFRKGVIGDWKNHLTKEQSERLDTKFYERFQGTDIYEKYKYLM